MHHYPSKLDLIVATAEYHWNNMVAEVRRLSLAIHEENLSLEEFIGGLWSDVFKERHVNTTLEIFLAGRTDARLRERVLPLLKRMYQTYDEIWLRFFRDTGASSEEIDMLLGHTFNLLCGMTLQRVLLKEDPKHDEKLLASWSEIMNSCLLEKRA